MDNAEIVRAWDDLWCEVVAVPHGHYMEFKLYDLQYVADDGHPPGYRRAGGVSSADVTNDRDEAQVYLSGDIKWDGCGNLHFDVQDDCMLHFCGRAPVAQLAARLARLWDLAEELIPAWCKRTAG